jgi:hypothetical protein
MITNDELARRIAAHPALAGFMRLPPNHMLAIVLAAEDVLETHAELEQPAPRRLPPPAPAAAVPPVVQLPNKPLGGPLPIPVPAKPKVVSDAELAAAAKRKHDAEVLAAREKEIADAEARLEADKAALAKEAAVASDEEAELEAIAKAAAEAAAAPLVVKPGPQQ